MQARRWTFTWNNYTEQDYERATHAVDHDAAVRFLIFGRETARTGTSHLQGYVEFSTPRRLAAVKRCLGGESLHLEPAKGSRDQNIQYCSKEDAHPFQYGDGPKQGSRTDLVSFIADAKSGKSVDELLELHPGPTARYWKMAKELQLRYSIKRDWPTHCIWRYGASGAGKSRDTYEEVKRMCPGSFSVLGDVSCKWFDGYDDGSKGVVLDEFDGTAQLPLVLQLLDRYPCRVAVKGDFRNWNPRYFFITSQFSPQEYYGSHGQYAALCRRLGETGLVIKYTRESPPEEHPPRFWLDQYDALTLTRNMGR